ncbi:hypothetical protein NLG97_g9268 [Lecanicillium saksenae]|uniref:Uncharacterized protein n=1 Tax=Lecanicillium saksenae TaxID=468837 RepID=A0ACC1QGI4_9HYPO|nr:hypothetical protein NLG97_g9268 [Lecanicillium saksenae]
MDTDNDESLASTIESDVDPDAEWPVKQVLAERQVDRSKWYLVEWENFPLSQATWEPKGNLNAAMLREWEITKKKQKAGEIPSFHTDEWVTAVNQSLREKEARHETRNRKRQLRGMRTRTMVRELKQVTTDAGRIPSDQLQVTRDDALEPSAADPGQAVLRHNSSDERSRRSSLDALFSDSESEMNTEHGSDLGDPVSEETAATKPTVEASTIVNTLGSNSIQQPEQLQHLFAGIAIESADGVNCNTINETHGALPTVIDMESDLGSDAMDIDDASCNSSPTKSCLASNNNKTTNSSRDEIKNGNIAADKDRQSLHQQDAGTERHVHKAGASDPITTEEATVFTCLSEAQTKKSGKRVSFSSAVPAKRHSKAEASLFVPERSSKDASSVATTKSSASVGLDLEHENGTRTRGECYESAPKTCVIGSTRLACSFYVSSRLPNSDYSLYDKLMEEETFHFSYVCTAQDFLRQLRATELSTGPWTTGTACSHLQADKLAAVSGSLHSSSFGLLYRNDEMCIVIYPSESADWKVPPLPTSPPPPAGHALRYLAFMPAANFQTSDMSLEFNLEYPPGIGVFDKQLYHKLLPAPDQQTKARNIPDSFFLVFPPSAKPEEELICHWLRLFNKNCEIRSCVMSGHWAKFLEVPRGAVILHQDCIPSLYRLPHFQKLLHSRNEDYNFWIFRLPFCSPISEPQSMDVYLEQVGIALDWAFPPGVAVLVTPSFFISQPIQAYNILKWTWQNFSDEAPIYRHGKLVVCHGVDDWLLSLALEKNAAKLDLRESKQTLDVRMKSFHLMKKLLEQDPDDITSPIVCAPVHLDGNDEQSLVNWFGWWSLSHIDQFRKFSVICSDNDDSRRLSRYINRSTLRGLFSGSDGATDNGTDGERSTLQLVADDSRECLSTYIRSVSNDAHASAWNPLVICPWPVFQHTGELRYGDASQWVNFFAEEYIGRIIDGKRHAGIKNTQLGLFYSANSENDQVGPRDAQPTHAWVAFVRPMELHRKPWKYSELLIWDYRLRDTTRQSQTITESELSPAQRHLITEVTEQYAKINLPLGKVWAGGFKASKAYSNSLDITLDWVKATVENVKGWLPLNHDDMLNRGWSLVRNRSSLSTEHSPAWSRSSAPSGRMDLDTSEGVQRILFNPPNHGSAKARPYPNRLYQWVMAPRVSRESEYTYVPTLEWYREQQESGRGFEHIRVCSWKAFFDHYKIDDPEK